MHLNDNEHHSHLTGEQSINVQSPARIQKHLVSGRCFGPDTDLRVSTSTTKRWHSSVHDVAPDDTATPKRK